MHYAGSNLYKCIIRKYKNGEKTMYRGIGKTAIFPLSIGLFCLFNAAVWTKAQTGTSQTLIDNKVIEEADCTASKLGSTIPVSAIGEPVV